jgi:hypothetical protein
VELQVDKDIVEVAEKSKGAGKAMDVADFNTDDLAFINRLYANVM